MLSKLQYCKNTWLQKTQVQIAVNASMQHVECQAVGLKKLVICDTQFSF